MILMGLAQITMTSPQHLYAASRNNSIIMDANYSPLRDTIAVVSSFAMDGRAILSVMAIA